MPSISTKCDFSMNGVTEVCLVEEMAEEVWRAKTKNQDVWFSHYPNFLSSLD